MKSMKQKIRTPFLLVVTVLPLIILLGFNIAIRIYIDQNTKQELNSTVSTMKTLIRKELVVSIYDPEETQLSTAFKNISSALIVSKLAGNTGFLLYNNSYSLLYPKDSSKSGVSSGMTAKISDYLKSKQIDKPTTLRYKGERVTVLGYRLTELPISDSPYVVFVVSGMWPNNLIRQVNLILGLIILIGFAVSVIIASRVSTRLSRPLGRLCKVTEQIGKGEFVETKESTDTVELATLYKSVNTMSRMLQDYDKAQKAFLQDASHELRTPLTSIQGYAEGIENGVLTDTKQAAAVIAAESRKLNVLVDELLTLSRIENQTYFKELGPLKLKDMLKEYYQSLNMTAKKAEKELSLTLPDEDITVLSSDALLCRAVGNIVTNCLRYAKTQVTIALTKEENNAVICIFDDGKGILEDDLPHLFERFYKGSNGNFGLGLAIARSAVEYMNGTITAGNKNPGAEFTVVLPLYDE